MQLSGPEILKRMNIINKNNADEQNPNGKPDIIIKPFDERCLGSNSYDLHLAPTLRVYTTTIPYGMLPAIKYDKNKEYTMKDWFDPVARNVAKTLGNKDPYVMYLAGDQEYDIRNPKFVIDPTKSHKTTEIIIPETGVILNPCIGYLGSTIEYTETHNLFPYIDGKSSIGRNFILNHHTAGRGDDGFCGTWTLEIRVLYPTVVYPYMRIGQIYYDKFIGQRKEYNKNKSSHYNLQDGPTAAAPVPVDSFIKEAYYNQDSITLRKDSAVVQQLQKHR